VLPLLERHFSVFAMDRRGRGESGDSTSYDLLREAEDLAAVVRAIGGPVNVFGHSHGALCALEAALLAPNVRRLMLYEGVPLRGANDFEDGAIERLEALLEAGDLEGVLVALLCDVVAMPAHDVGKLRAERDAWRVRLSNARTTPRELRAYAEYVFDAARFGALPVPTLLLVGSDSPSRELENARAVARALPDAKVGILAGQQHIAMHTAPAALVDEITRFVA
jgi:pimeloyl-ACP methyl ester carboxylesterase